MQQYRNVTLSVDIMKVNGIPLLMTILRHIKFSSAGKLDTLKNETIINHFRVVMHVYASCRFHVTIILVNNQFKSTQGDLADLGAVINVVSHDEHSPKVER